MNRRARPVLVWGVWLTAIVFGPGLYQLLRLTWTQWRLDRQLSRLSIQQEQLRAEQARLQSDPVYIEGRIRSTFKVAQPGEVVIPLESKKIRR